MSNAPVPAFELLERENELLDKDLKVAIKRKRVYEDALREIKAVAVEPLDSMRSAKRQYRERGERMLDIAHNALRWIEGGNG